jgi:hypothetical protein
LWLRALTLYATPEALLSADTNSYWDRVPQLWYKGKFSVPEKRRWLYPLLLMAAPALPGNTPQAVALAQHALGLVAIVGVGWIAGQLTRWRVFVVPLATLLFAASPRGLGYEHQIIADSAMTNFFILAAAVALPLHGITQRRLAWTLALCAVVVALKPHGKPLALPIIVAAACFAGLPWRWHWANWLLLAFCGVLFLNAGSSRQGSWLLLSSTLPLVPENGEPYGQYRAALAPVIREARALGDDYPWEQYRYKKLLSDSDSYEDLTVGKSFAEAGPEWNPLTRQKQEFGRVTSALARSGLRAAPLTWLRFTFLKIARGLADSEAVLLGLFHPAAFWEDQRVRNDERWIERTKAITLMYEMDRATFDKFVRARIARTVPDPTTNPTIALAAQVHWFTDDLAARRVHWTWIGALGALGLAASLRRANAWPVIGAFALSLLTSYGIGDAIPRYVYPVEWLLYLFPLLGIAALADALCFMLPSSSFSSSSSSSADAGNEEDEDEVKDEESLPQT